jgi:hypothetical protein
VEGTLPDHFPDHLGEWGEGENRQQLRPYRREKTDLLNTQQDSLTFGI